MSKPLIVLYIVASICALLFLAGPTYVTIYPVRPHSVPVWIVSLWLASGYIGLGSVMFASRLESRLSFNRLMQRNGF